MKDLTCVLLVPSSQRELALVAFVLSASSGCPGLLSGTRSNQMFPVLISLCWEEPFYLCFFTAIKAYSTLSTTRPLAMQSSPASCLEVLIHSLRRQARRGLPLIDQSNTIPSQLSLETQALSTWKMKTRDGSLVWDGSVCWIFLFFLQLRKKIK